MLGSSALGELDVWLTAGIVALVIGALVASRIGAELVMLGALALLLLAGVLEPGEAVAGFANPAVVTVALLYVVAAGLRETGALQGVTARLLGRPSGPRTAQARLMAPVAAASAFVSNTPIVAMLMPSLSEWGRRNRIPASHLLMPLSFAAILGGMCSLIGTSTNLVVNGMLTAQGGDAERGMGMFTMAQVGVPVAIIGFAYLLMMGRTLLPAHEDREAGPGAREYSTAMRVGDDAPMVGKSIEEAGLRRLPGLYLMRIEREGETVVAASPTQVIRAGDVLVFVGDLDSVIDLRRFRGLEPMVDGGGLSDYVERRRPSLVEAVIAPGAKVLGETVRDAAFRTRYGAAIVAVSRHGERLDGKIGDIRLRAGDTLLVEANPEFVTRARSSREFYMASELPGSAAPRHRLAWVALTILAGMVVLITWRPEHAMSFALAAALGMVLFRCCNGAEARTSVDIQVLLVIGCAFGLGKAIEKTGLAGSVAESVIETGASLGAIGLLAIVYLLTAVLTSVITNNAAAILMFPIALATAQQHALPVMPFAICVAIAASAGFATPLGYQTNLMVLGPGGYRTRDFLKLGAPLTLLTGVVCVFVLAALYPLG